MAEENLEEVMRMFHVGDSPELIELAMKDALRDMRSDSVDDEDDSDEV